MDFKPLVPKPIKRKIKSKLVLKNKVLIGSHHKTGTVWMQKVFFTITKKFKLHMESRYLGETPPSSFDIYFHTHSDFDFSSINETFMGLHIIRDPRDLIVSATHYHTRSSESWLHAKNREFGGMTYQEKINTYSSFDDQLLFEMEHSSRHNIMAIKNWDYDDKRFLNIHYEDLVQDKELELFENIFNHLGFRDWCIGWCLVSAYRNSLFSGGVNTKHVRSGKPRQWPQYFKSIHKKRFVELFGDFLDTIGYESNQDIDWNSL